MNRLLIVLAFGVIGQRMKSAHHAEAPFKPDAWSYAGSVSVHDAGKVEAMLHKRGIRTLASSHAGIVDVCVKPSRKREATKLLIIGSRKYGYRFWT